jgi:hypothetical protein
MPKLRQQKKLLEKILSGKNALVVAPQEHL